MKKIAKGRNPMIAARLVKTVLSAAAVLFMLSTARTETAKPAAEKSAKSAAKPAKKKSTPAKAKGPAAKKTATPPPAAPNQAAQESAKPAAPAPAASAEKAAPASDAGAKGPADSDGAGDALQDVTIQGDIVNEIPVRKDMPPLDVAFQDVADLSREGQTDRVLTGPIEHMTGREQMGLAQAGSLQTFLPLPVRIPQPPIFRLEVSPGLTAARWEIQVVDEDNKTLPGVSGTTLPRNLVEWDGFSGGKFQVRVGPAYTPILVLVDEHGGRRRLFGEPVSLSAVQYVQDGALRVEFDNERLFQKGRAEFAPDMTPYLQAALSVMRARMGDGPFRVTMYARPGGGLPLQKRVEALRSFFFENLSLEADMLSVSSAAPQSRGDVTEIVVPVRSK